MISEKEFITAYAGLIVSEEGFRNRPNIQDIIKSGRITLDAVAMILKGLTIANAEALDIIA